MKIILLQVKSHLGWPVCFQAELDDNSEDKDYDPRKELKKRRIDARTPAGTGRTNRKGRRYLAQKKARSTGPLRMVSATSSGVMPPPVCVDPLASASATSSGSCQHSCSLSSCHHCWHNDSVGMAWAEGGLTCAGKHKTGCWQRGNSSWSGGMYMKVSL